jgi:hypothetical protein
MDISIIGYTFQGLQVYCGVVFLILLILLRNGDTIFSRSLSLGIIGYNPLHLAYSGIGSVTRDTGLAYSRIGPPFRAF